MPHDTVETERERTEHVLEILEQAAARLDSPASVPLWLLHDLIDYVQASEENALDEMEADDDRPAATLCAVQPLAARRQIATMRAALRALELGLPGASAPFVGAARGYVRLRRAHLQSDDRIIDAATAAGANIHDCPSPLATVENAAARQLYERLIQGLSAADVGISPVFPGSRHQAPGVSTST